MTYALDERSPPFRPALVFCDFCSDLMEEDAEVLEASGYNLCPHCIERELENHGNV